MIRWKLVLLYLVAGQLMTGACKNSTDSLLIDQQALSHTCPLDPYGAILVVLDKQGHNLVTSFQDEITTKPVTGTTSQKLPNYVFRLLQSSKDTVHSTKYGGMGYAIGSSIPAHSVEGRDPINNFILSINGQVIGTLYCNVKSKSYEEGCYSNTTLLFNGKAIPVDSSVVPYASVIQL